VVRQDRPPRSRANNRNGAPVKEGFTGPPSSPFRARPSVYRRRGDVLDIHVSAIFSCSVFAPRQNSAQRAALVLRG
jgi:hypothetical protein